MIFSLSYPLKEERILDGLNSSLSATLKSKLKEIVDEGYVLNDKNKEARTNADLVIDLLLPKLTLDIISSAMKGFLPQE